MILLRPAEGVLGDSGLGQGAEQTGANNNTIHHNILYTAGKTITKIGASTTIRNNSGFVTEAHGNASISTTHGNFEYGEDYVYFSHHGAKQLVRGFARLYRLTGSIVFQEWMAYYFEQAILLCKRVDEVTNNSATNNQNVHTGGLISTIDWNGVVAGEAESDWHVFLTDALLYHPALLSVHYFYLYASLAHMTWAYRDSSTYQSSSAFSYAFASPGTSYCGFSTGIDNSRFIYFAPNAALHLLPTYTLAACDNPNVFSSCLEASFAATLPAGRTILLYNPQTTPQTANLTIRGQAAKTIRQDGVSITGTPSGIDVTVSLLLSPGQITKITTR